MDRFYFICDEDCYLSGVNYIKGQMYNVDENLILNRFIMVNNMDGESMGYVSEYEFDCYFITARNVLVEVDKMFNNVMDYGISMH